jgi:biotin transport system substrate-specific component
MLNGEHRTECSVDGEAMSEKSAVQVLASPQERALEASRQVALVMGASVVVALCARITIPLMPLTPVPLTVQNLGVLLVGLLLGSRRGFAALALYLVEGAVGLPVFNPTGPGGIAQLLGPTGGFLMVYPFVAFLAGYIFERGAKTFLRAATAGLLAEILLFAGGLTWLYVFTHSLAKAAYLGLYWFLAAEVIKIMLGAAIATRWQRRPFKSAVKQ